VVKPEGFVCSRDVAGEAPGGPGCREEVGGVAPEAGCADFRSRAARISAGTTPMPPSQMTKKLWEFVKRHKLATKG
jgi:hypothetical protein